MTGADKPNIKILISCHKEVPLPDSDMFLPVQVGATNTSQRFKGMQPDDEGSNISDRNFTFCELTAQYWAWKNLDADYYGLCHYRRYFCFDGLTHETNDHLQIEEDSLSSFTFRDYRLDDADLIEESVIGCDLITPPYWDISEAVTPDGIKHTIREHMAAFGLFCEEDLSLLREIVAEKQPEYLVDLDSYLNGRKYLGYNCYIMKKDLFNRFCEFEFSILQEFDKRFDYEGLTTTRKRVCGYMGEILYSVFTRRIDAESQYHVKQYPLMFFLDTSVSCAPKEVTVEAKEPIRILWRYRDRPVSPLVVCLESLLSHLHQETKYEITFLHEEDFVFESVLNAIDAFPDNVRICHSQWSVFRCPFEIPDLSLSDFDILQPLLIPWLSGGYGRVIWIDGLAIFQDDPARLIDGIQSDMPYACMQNILLQRELNKPAMSNVLDEYKLDVRSDVILDTTIMVVNSVTARQEMNPKVLADQLTTLRNECAYLNPKREEYKPEIRKKTEVPSAYLLGNQAFRARLLRLAQSAPIAFDEVSTSLDLADTGLWANEETSWAWKRAQRPLLIYPEYGKPPLLSASHRFRKEFWMVARNTSVYEVLLAEELEPAAPSLRRFLLPEGSQRRKLISKLVKKFR